MQGLPDKLVIVEFIGNKGQMSQVNTANFAYLFIINTHRDSYLLCVYSCFSYPNSTRNVICIDIGSPSYLLSNPFALLYSQLLIIIKRQKLIFDKLY